MPYVEVWVDHECDGDCEAGRERDEMGKTIEEAASLIRQGLYDAALHALTNDRACMVKSPEAIAADYKLVKEGKSPLFRLYSEARA